MRFSCRTSYPVVGWCIILCQQSKEDEADRVEKFSNCSKKNENETYHKFLIKIFCSYETNGFRHSVVFNWEKVDPDSDEFRVSNRNYHSDERIDYSWVEEFCFFLLVVVCFSKIWIRSNRRCASAMSFFFINYTESNLERMQINRMRPVDRFFF